MKAIKIAAHIPNFSDATSWYRGSGPLAALEKSHNIKVHYLPVQSPPDWAQLKSCDLLFMQRPCGPDHLAWLYCAKDNGLPAIVDFDDNNLAVPIRNPTYDVYAQPAMRDALVKIARAADHISVSTNFLKDLYCIYNKNVTVVPNAIDDSLLPLRQGLDRPYANLILWRGTATHHENLTGIKSAILELGKKHSDWLLGFQGVSPAWAFPVILDIAEQIKNHQIWPAYGLHDMHKVHVSIHPKLMYCALANNDHSQARSHVSWLEASLCGAAFVGPDIEEFRRPGVTNFTDATSFVEAVEKVMASDHVALIQQSWDCIQEKYMLSKVNPMRLEVIEKVLSGMKQ